MPEVNRIARRDIDWLQVFWGGVLVAAADIVFATTLWFDWSVPGLTRVFQSIAVGVLGQTSYQGGVATALLGAVLHVFMATLFVVASTVVGLRLPRLLRRPWLYGPPYGVLLYVIMNFVVMPLSRVGRTPSLEHPDWILLAILAHMVFGVVCIVFARRALKCGLGMDAS